MEIHDNVDSHDPGDSAEIPARSNTFSKPEVIVPDAVSEVTTHATADLRKATESIVCSKSVIFLTVFKNYFK